VTEIDGRIIGKGTAGRITMNLLDEFQDYVKGKGEKI
jgi:hypothetical protein